MSVFDLDASFGGVAAIRRRTALVLRTLSLAAALLHAPTLAAWQRSAPARCNLGEPNAILIREGDQRAADGRLLVRWDMKTSAVWDGTAEPSKGAYRSFRDELARRLVSTDPRRVLRRSPTTNNLLVLAHARIWIKPATCLEKSLYGLQHDRISTFDEPTEFSAFVLSTPDNKTQRIYWYSVNRNGIGNASPLTDPVRGDVMAGWRVRYVLHSHPFKPSDDFLNGIIAPSKPDAHFQVNMRHAVSLPESRITNGVDTVHIPAAAFGSFDQG